MLVFPEVDNSTSVDFYHRFAQPHRKDHIWGSASGKALAFYERPRKASRSRSKQPTEAEVYHQGHHRILAPAERGWCSKPISKMSSAGLVSTLGSAPFTTTLGILHILSISPSSKRSRGTKAFISDAETCGSCAVPSLCESGSESLLPSLSYSSHSRLHPRHRQIVDYSRAVVCHDRQGQTL